MFVSSDVEIFAALSCNSTSSARPLFPDSSRRSSAVSSSSIVERIMSNTSSSKEWRASGAVLCVLDLPERDVGTRRMRAAERGSVVRRAADASRSRSGASSSSSSSPESSSSDELPSPFLTMHGCSKVPAVSDASVSMSLWSLSKTTVSNRELMMYPKRMKLLNCLSCKGNHRLRWSSQSLRFRSLESQLGTLSSLSSLSGVLAARGGAIAPKWMKD